MQEVDYNQAFKRLNKKDFIELSMPLAFWAVKNSLNQIDYLCEQLGIDKDDLYQEAALGLMVAYDHFDVTRGIKWSTYAIITVKQRLLQFIRYNKKRSHFINGMLRFNQPYLDEQGHETYLEDAVGGNCKEFEEIENEAIEEFLTSKLIKILNPWELKIHTMIRENPKIRQREIANFTGLSQSYVSRVRNRVIAKGKEIMKFIDKEGHE